jgi:phage pi2 protein 07
MADFLFSNEIEEIIDKINEEYLKDSDLIIKIMRFFAEAVEIFIDEKYLLVSKDTVKELSDKALMIWENKNHFENNELKEKFRKIYFAYYSNKLTEIKPLKEILKNEKERAAMFCIIILTTTDYIEPEFALAYNFIECFVDDMMDYFDIGEDKIKILLEKYFDGIIK